VLKKPQRPDPKEQDKEKKELQEKQEQIKRATLRSNKTTEEKKVETITPVTTDLIVSLFYLGSCLGTNLWKGKPCNN
jgi:hypothetical protein